MLKGRRVHYVRLPFRTMKRRTCLEMCVLRKRVFENMF